MSKTAMLQSLADALDDAGDFLLDTLKDVPAEALEKARSWEQNLRYIARKLISTDPKDRRIGRVAMKGYSFAAQYEAIWGKLKVKRSVRRAAGKPLNAFLSILETLASVAGLVL